MIVTEEVEIESAVRIRVKWRCAYDWHQKRHPLEQPMATQRATETLPVVVTGDAPDQRQ